MTTFDVVHAHQVLQHLPDPVGALREMRRVCKPGGVVAARDSDYAAFTWYPEVPALTAWLVLYEQIARANGGEPDAGRFLLGWAHAAGFSEVQAGASTWCYATPEDRELVGRPLGRPHDDVRDRRPGRARRLREPGRARDDGGGLAHVGRASRRLVRRAARRDRLPPVARDQAGMARPPSITSVWPVTNLASSLAKNTHAPARSSGSSVDFIAVCAVMPSMKKSGTIFFVASVIVTPGAMQFTVMFQLPSCAAMNFVSPTMPHFVIE